MKFSIRLLLMLVLLVAVFFAGWVAKTNYDQLQAPAALQITPTMDGVVLRARNNLTAISLGSDDGLAASSIGNFYRGNAIIGRGEVTSVKANMAVVRPLDGVKISEGDRINFQF